MEILLIAVIVLFLLQYNKKIDTNKFFQDNKVYLKFLKEEDYEFLVSIRYGDKVDPNLLFEKRLQLGFITIIFVLFLFISSINLLNILLAILLGYLMFKNGYSSLKSYYKKHLHTIDTMLPYYLKSLEILAQHYTVPIAINKSIESAPDIFKPGLHRLIKKINSGDSTINPYVDFAIEYPVRDSMRMMRLLYRLGLGNQENKVEQLLVFSKTVSSLQNKARETKYKERLNAFENKTMLMLGVTGGGVMIILLISMMMMFQM